MSEVLRSFFSYQLAVGSTMSEYTQVVDMRKSSVTSRSSFPSGASSCQTTSDRLLLAGLAQILALDAVRGAEQMLQEILVALAAGAQDVGAPDEQIARPVDRIVGILAGELELAGLERRGDVILGSLPAASAALPTIERIRLECGADGSQPMRSARTLKSIRLPCHCLVRAVGERISSTRQRFVAPLIAVGIPVGRRVHLPRRAAQSSAKASGSPAGLRPQLLLADIMRPAAAFLTDATAHHQHVDDAAIGHVHVVPVIDPGAENDHRLPLVFSALLGEGAGDGDRPGHAARR